MDFKDQIKLLGERVNKLKAQVQTEEATKNAFIMPFIRELGYDVFNPAEVTPELVADVGIKQGEKIDYAILKDGEPIILIECKHHGAPLSVHNASQLFRYFHTTKAKFSILTNGIEYRFYTDLVETNKMDEKPFFAFNITDIRDNQIEELKKFHKAYYDFDNIVTTASELKYTYELKKLIDSEFNEPSADFVKHFARQVYPGPITAKVLEQFLNLTKKSLHQYISDMITDRLKSALNKEDETSRELEVITESAKPADSVITTEEELEGFLIVKTILRQKVNASRIVHRDAQSYFAILLDDNNRKTLCRLYLNGSKKYLAVLDEQRKEIKHEIATVDDIFKHSDILSDALAAYEKDKETA
ncbi:type I restriction enzyme HsdR N-terminal domain-containing protein [Flavobacterium sp. MAH-1]|uniref:Type I restriction enzyme HsdR N-terminal domain-containing protein n=1 Tax=Flavobacterium agri TaxID=2743471 RepID=A0A7Y8XZP4_9FLAO|nr:type I restriction endonuclease [Flavobacterium agri]NUY79671.1 type I restriction enzyme HsdR N-terminal domain-containing protein [Flavobacterium agri]NYA69696.1 type I restriction enzyme HsdR N-terminal domain-containing protein [Flavobacterium agri]